MTSILKLLEEDARYTAKELAEMTGKSEAEVKEIVEKLDETERLLGDYSPGRFAWVLKNPRKLPTPIPARGQLGFWEWTPPEEVGKA